MHAHILSLIYRNTEKEKKRKARHAGALLLSQYSGGGGRGLLVYISESRLARIVTQRNTVSTNRWTDRGRGEGEGGKERRKWGERKK